MEFPRWMYHQEQTARIFHTPQELESAGAGWFDSPLLFPSDDSTGSTVDLTPELDALIEPRRGPGRPRKVAQ